MDLGSSAQTKVERNYPLNCWWVAGFSDEIVHDLVGRWLLDTPVLLYRKSDGTVSAMEDRCPHRAAPLSMGRLVGDSVQCGYHGFTFNQDGQCTLVPSTGRPLAMAKVRVFPVIENPPFVWVYLGDPEKIAEVPLPHQLDWAQDHRFSSVKGRLDVSANYILLKENVLDLTHFGFVHANSFKITDFVSSPSFETDAWTTTYRQSFKNSPLAAFYADPLGIEPGTPFDREAWGSFVSPALQTAGVDFVRPSDRKTMGQFRVTHATTPVDHGKMLYFWVIARDYGTSPEQLAALEKATLTGFYEDEAVLVAIQNMHDRYALDAQPEVSVKADTGGVQCRRLIERWMARETTIQSGET
jgi:phenylpropionate dioxygenase-like ring-hydroxylating dioxygenase large terminal subunit